MKNTIEQGLHEKLCAYVLGEGTQFERAQVERELAQNADLRAEKAQLEATIGLVRGSLEPKETLSQEANAVLASAAKPVAPVRGWASGPWLRIAAGVMAVGVSYGVLRIVSKDEFETRIARAPAAERARGDELAQTNAPVSGWAPSEANEEREKSELGRALGVQKDAKEAEVTLADATGRSEIRGRLQLDPLVIDARKQNPPGPVLKYSEVGAIDPASNAGEARSNETAAKNRQDGLAAVGFDAVRSASARDGSSSAPASTPAAPREGDFVGRYGGAESAGQAPKLEDNAATGGGAQPEPSGERKLGKGLKKGRAGGPTTGSATAPSTPAPSAGLVVHGGGGGGPSTPGASGPVAGPPSDGGTAAALRQRLHAIGYAAGDASSRSGAAGEVSKGVGLAAGDDGEALDHDDVSLPVELRVERQTRRILDGCIRRPNERPRDMFFRFWGDNPFEVAALDSLSTFSIDVDTASYALARRYLKQGNLPTKEQVRTEEFVNYFKTDVAPPTDGSTFRVHTDLTPSRFSADSTRQMLRVSVKGKEITQEERKPLVLSFVIDVSGSMKEQNRLETVKHCMRLLAHQLDANDRIGIISFSTDAQVVLPTISAGNRLAIEEAMQPLRPDGSTNSNAGLQLGYAMALQALDPNAVNRVVFLSDGVANVGETDPARISDGVKTIREKGIYLNTIGVGMNNHNDVLLEQLANKSDGVCNYVDDEKEAKRALVENFTGAFQPIARDVKIQVEFDPAQVMRYRLLGYENRAIADAAFRDDKVDAGEVGAGQSVTALYELEMAGGVSEMPLATVRLRWKAPKTAGASEEADKVTEAGFPVLASSRTSFEGAGQGYRKHAIVAQFAEFLRRSIHVRGESLDALIAEGQRLAVEAPGDAEFVELVSLIKASRELILRAQPGCDELCQAVDAIREREYLRAQLELVKTEQDQKTLEFLQKQNQEMEAQLRELIKRRIEKR